MYYATGKLQYRELFKN